MKSPVPSLFGKNPTYAASRVGRISFVTRNDVDVSVGNGLAGNRTIIDPYVESVGAVFFPEDGAGQIHCAPKGLKVDGWEIEDRLCDVFGYYQRVSWSYGKSIKEGNRVFVFVDDARRVYRMKG
jgi:hypothetical protein